MRERLAEKLVESSDLIVKSSQLPEQRAKLMSSLSLALAQLGRPQEALAVINEAIEIAGDQCEADGFLHLQINLAFTHNSLSQFSEVIEVLDPRMDRILANESLTFSEQVEAANLLADAWFQLANTIGNAAALPRAQTGYQRVMDLLENCETIPQDLLTIDLAARFRQNSLDGFPQLSNKQLDALGEIVEEAQATLGDDSAIYNTMIWTLASYYTRNNQHEQAIELAEKAVELAEANFGPTSDMAVKSLDVLIIACANSGNHQRLLEILPDAQQRCELMIQRKGESHYDAMTVFGNVATAWGVMGQLDKCIDVKRKHVAIAAEEFGPRQSANSGDFNGPWRVVASQRRTGASQTAFRRV